MKRIIVGTAQKKKNTCLSTNILENNKTGRSRQNFYLGYLTLKVIFQKWQ
jgi:hypothetical protein